MFIPNFINIVSFFYPIGNTPAVCLTQDLPRETPAQILLLGCGDVRNILFTTYSDEHRTFDITCCDIEVAILARNVLLLTLVVDNADGSKSGAIWNIYYHLYLDEESYQVLQDQSGSFMRFRTPSNLGIKVDMVVSSGCVTELVKSYEKRFESALQRAKDTRKARTGNSLVLTGFRTTAPVSLQSMEDLPRLHEEFWNNGTTERDDKVRCNAVRPNPMFVASAKGTSILHYGTDPLLGFHLATAYAPLHSESPLQVQHCKSLGLQKLVEAAKVQFQAWCSAFRSRIPEKITIRFFAGDALSFCHTLQHQRSSKRDSPAHLYRDPFHSEPLILNDCDYGATGSAPTTFNVIDTSNLLDHLGALNLLVASSPLLSEELASSLFTETLVKREKSLKAMSDELLCGHFPTISILIGLFPVEYWTNATAVSIVDEAIFDVLCRMTDGSKNDDGQIYCRFAWKRAPTKQVSSVKRTSSRLSFNDSDLANILFRVYQKMFQHENMGLLFSSISLQRLKNNSCPHYHRGSLAAFLALVKSRVSANWDRVMGAFIDLVENDSSILMGRHYIQELYLYLHLFDLYSVPILETGSCVDGNLLNLGVAKRLKSSSPVLCLTLKVPRAELKAFLEIPYTELGTPVVHGILQSSDYFAGRPWQNIFSAVQVVFGEVSTSGSRRGGDCKLTIHKDEDGWIGESPLFVSFYVPSWITCLEPQTATVCFGIQSTPQSSLTFTKHFGLDLNIYKTWLGNEENVFVTTYAPNQSGRPCICPKLEALNSQPTDDFLDTAITPVVDTTRAQITALTGRINLKSKHAQDSFRKGVRAETTQTSVCVITISIGTELQYQLCFPAPVIQSRSKLRLARKSSYIEVVAPIANPGGQDHLQHFMYPTFLDKSYPVNWNLPRLKLDRLPILDTTKMEKLQWLITHTSLMFSTRERALRETSIKMENGIHGDVRLNYKESLFTIFMSFSGVQGTRSKIFRLSDSTRGGVSIIIIGSRLRLDLANHTVVLDAAVLPLTHSLIPQIRSFLEVISTMGMCIINMYDEEMTLWKQTIPAYIERCRDWNHTLSCEYLISSCIPIPSDNTKNFVCSCGTGRLPSGFTSGIPQWETISKHALRIALSPSFSVPYVEGVCEIDERRVSESDASKCDTCGGGGRSGGGPLLKCARCQNARYCSVECQRVKWKVHKRTCRRVALPT